MGAALRQREPDLIGRLATGEHVEGEAARVWRHDAGV